MVVIFMLEIRCNQSGAWEEINEGRVIIIERDVLSKSDRLLFSLNEFKIQWSLNSKILYIYNYLFRFFSKP